MGRLPIREQERRLRKEIILDAALERIARDGYAAMTMDDLAADVGLSKTGLYQLFPQKEAIAVAAVVRLLVRVEEHLDAHLAGDLRAIDQLKETLRWTLHIRFGQSGWPDLLQVKSAITPQLGPDSNLAVHMNQLTVRLAALVERAKTQGDIERHLPTPFIVHSLLACVRAYGFDEMITPGGCSADDMIGLLTQQFFAGLNTTGETADAANRR